jgi:xanthine dehydrogenase accessory factor
MANVYEEIVGIQDSGGKAALAPVVAVKGSTPRAEGSHMLIRPDLSISGSIGGGCIEASVWKEAVSAIETGRGRLLDYDLTGREETEEGLICGGTMQVLVEPVLPGLYSDVFAEAVRLGHAGETTAMATLIGSAGPAGKLLITMNGGSVGLAGTALDGLIREAGIDVIRARLPRFIDIEPNRLYLEPVFPEPSVYIFGAGHIGFAVSKIAALTGFRVVVIDDRPAYACRERFPDASAFHVEDPADAVARLGLNPSSYAIIACRGHLEDQRVIKEVLKTTAGYIGMLGSRKKTKTVFANLVKEGVSTTALGRIHSPIGLPIATETPEEIAVSIMAEIINIRRRRKMIAPVAG